MPLPGLKSIYIHIPSLRYHGGIFIKHTSSEKTCTDLTKVNKPFLKCSFTMNYKNAIFPTVKPISDIVNNRTLVSSTRQLKKTSITELTYAFATQNSLLTIPPLSTCGEGLGVRYIFFTFAPYSKEKQ